VGPHHSNTDEEASKFPSDFMLGNTVYEPDLQNRSFGQVGLEMGGWPKNGREASYAMRVAGLSFWGTCQRQTYERIHRLVPE
jgi:hypothetical protein